MSGPRCHARRSSDARTRVISASGSHHPCYSRHSRAAPSSFLRRQEPRNSLEPRTPHHLHPRQQAQRHTVRRRNPRPGQTRLGASERLRRRLHPPLPGPLPCMVRAARRYDLGDHSREAPQEMETCLEATADRGGQSAVAGLVGRHRIALGSRLRGNDPGADSRPAPPGPASGSPRERGNLSPPPLRSACL